MAQAAQLVRLLAGDGLPEHDAIAAVTRKPAKDACQAHMPVNSFRLQGVSCLTVHTICEHCKLLTGIGATASPMHGCRMCKTGNVVACIKLVMSTNKITTHFLVGRAC